MTPELTLQDLLERCDTEFILSHYQLIPYSIKLTLPWQSASVFMNYRQGFLVHLFTRQGLIATGDCAPLPELGTETLLQAQEQARKILHNKNNSLISKSWLDNLNSYPALYFALETAILSLICQHKKQNLAQLLNPDYSFKIKLNTVYGNISTATEESIKAAEKKGFQCLKFKLGLQEIKQDAHCLKQILERIQPETKIRLDCNKSWSFKQSQWFINYIDNELSPYQHHLDSLEEPLQYYHCEQYQQLQAQCIFSLALDESLAQVKDLKQLPVKRIILKPTLCGGIINAWALAQKAKLSGIEVVVTSAIETAYGLWPISYLAAALDNQQFHGLATASWLEDSLIPAPDIKNGSITIYH